MDPAIKKIRDTFIRQLGDEMRADGFDDKRIAWLLGPEAVAANGNEPKRRGRPMGAKDGTVRARVVECLIANGPMSCAELAKLTGMAPSNLRTWIRMNERKGYVRRHRNLDGGRLRTVIEAL